MATQRLEQSATPLARDESDALKSAVMWTAATLCNRLVQREGAADAHCRDAAQARERG